MGTSGDEAWGVMMREGNRGLERKNRRVPACNGIDEKWVGKGHNYEGIVCGLNSATVEYVVDDRNKESLESHYQQFDLEELAQIESIALDMSLPYVLATNAHIQDAGEKIIFGRFPAAKQVTAAVGKVRRAEHTTVAKRGDERLKSMKYPWLRNEENIPDWRREEFAAVKSAELKTSSERVIKATLRKFCSYSCVKCAEKYFKVWYFWATDSRIAPMIEAAKTLKRHLASLLAYFKYRITNATSEGINSKIQMVKMMVIGYRTGTITVLRSTSIAAVSTFIPVP